MNHLIASLLALLFVAYPLSAQEPYQLRVDSRLIQISLTVQDAKGKPVTQLSQQDFHLVEDGAAQTIRYFAKDRQLPLSIGLLVDASGSQDKFVKEHQREIESFLKTIMEPRDRAFAVCFGNHLRLCSDWSSDAATVLSGIQRFHKGDRDMPEIGPREDRDLGTGLNDAVWYAVAETMRQEQGRRKVLVLFTDGEENSSEHDEVDAIAQAQSSDVLVFALQTTERRVSKETARDRYGARLLEHLTTASGGRGYDVRVMKTDQVFQQMAEDLRSMYEVGYYSTNTARDGSFRKVTVTADGDGLQVRARSGYTPR